MPEVEPQVIIIFLMMIAAGIKALIERAAERRKREQPEEPPANVFEDFKDLGREFLERQKIIERQTGVAVPPPIPVPSPTPPVAQEVKKPLLTDAERAALARFEEKSKTPHRRRGKTLSTKARLRAHLSSPTAAREALLLSEILGTPKGLR